MVTTQTNNGNQKLKRVLNPCLSQTSFQGSVVCGNLPRVSPVVIHIKPLRGFKNLKANQSTGWGSTLDWHKQ